MMIEKFAVGEKQATLYAAEMADCPLIVLNTYTGDGASVVAEIERLRVGEPNAAANEANAEQYNAAAAEAAPAEKTAPDYNLLVVGNLNWDHDMTPWYCPPLTPDDTPCTGGADDYLALLREEIMPRALDLLNGTPAFTGIAGYSLAGLFALYAMYRCGTFDRCASMSGSLWFPDFVDFVRGHEMVNQPAKVYLSLGDREAKVRNQMLRCVRDNTEAIAAHFKDAGIDVTWELNPGNHFRDGALRSAKGILGIL